ncbi:magnesium protoporphyrin O-methyltransferase [Rubidibacter lacunae KORDI 51-2]|uniref:Magnesium protoporphyrin IX methyltransferase n=1 Tax=Rubidibacter lacunae KORDI 51-2 TaxID=582515 RepID=U5DMT5_9CHRO|nr:magnesium protoporphyrin IX methyltransferase [Rubidibacter lacunae]ERN42986.1 magnesium protoporphyrin O-methyltransferase [Rubidibacter lacunae KORDI 51-2]
MTGTNTTDRGTDDKTIVRDYFNSTGFERWRRIYGTTAEVNKVQRDIRVGHQQTIDTVLAWLQADGVTTGQTICDVGCGVGSLSIPLAKSGARVFASDISEKMVGEAQARAQQELSNNSSVTFSVQDMDAIAGSYHTVICLDVLIHYPLADAVQTISRLAASSEERLILSFAPKTPLLTLLKKIGEFFPGPSKTTRAYQHTERDIVAALQAEGFAIRRQAMTSTRFYFSRVLEAVRERNA